MKATLNVSPEVEVTFTDPVKEALKRGILSNFNGVNCSLMLLPACYRQEVHGWGLNAESAKRQFDSNLLQVIELVDKGQLPLVEAQKIFEQPVLVRQLKEIEEHQFGIRGNPNSAAMLEAPVSQPVRFDDLRPVAGTRS